MAQNKGARHRRFAFWQDGHSEISHPDYIRDLPDDAEHGQLLVLEMAKSDADNIVQLICAAMLIIDGFPLVKNPPQSGFELPETSSKMDKVVQNVFRTHGFFQWFTFHDELPLAVALASKIWHKKKSIYAAHKLASSFETESITPWSAHPKHGQMFEKHSEEYYDHVRTSTAINLAYSAIEELGLQIKSSAQKPRWSDRKLFIWNPEVLEDITRRLKMVGIDQDDEYEWLFRGEKTEAKIEIRQNVLSDHSDGRKVRDVTVSIPDAIHACSYLRNFMTAHAFSSSTPKLGPYEVFNVQSIARRLLLSSCDLWNVWTDGLIAAQQGN